jgi:hypothetical protein
VRALRDEPTDHIPLGRSFKECSARDDGWGELEAFQGGQKTEPGEGDDV